MADILSQEEIDRLLTVPMVDNDWPMYFYIKNTKLEIIEVDKEFAENTLNMDLTQDVYDYDVKYAVENVLNSEVKEMMYGRKYVAQAMLKKQQTLRELQLEIEFIDNWIETHPEYLI